MQGSAPVPVDIAPASGDVLVEVTLGTETGTSQRRWKAARRGSLVLN